MRTVVFSVLRTVDCTVDLTVFRTADFTVGFTVLFTVDCTVEWIGDFTDGCTASVLLGLATRAFFIELRWLIRDFFWIDIGAPLENF
ncbi:MAG TPA: hypothetical protein VEG30_16630 [Terriglobales bacterium]|nr:hypothetical protein [Terriglobales bacterium]